jgi:uncharacterized protein (TIGR02594 family)
MKLPLTFAVPVLVSVAAVLQSSTPAEARPRHHHHRVAPAQTAPQPSFDNPLAALGAAVSGQAVAGRVTSRRMARAERRYNRIAARQNTVRFANVQPHPDVEAAVASDAPANMPARAFAGIGGSDLITEARRYMGGNPTGKSSLWCGNFMNLVLQRTGHTVSNSNQARSFASYGQRVSGPQVGAIAVMSRNGGGHVGIVTGVDAKGNIMVLSGNHNRRVAEAPYPASRIYAYVMPK